MNNDIKLKRSLILSDYIITYYVSIKISQGLKEMGRGKLFSLILSLGVGATLPSSTNEFLVYNKATILINFLMR